MNAERVRFGSQGATQPLIYGLPWLIYFFAFAAVFLTTGQYDLFQVMVGAAANVLPPAVLGWLVLTSRPFLSWPPKSRSRFVMLHVLAGLAFSVSAVTMTWMVFTADASIKAGSFTIPPLVPVIIATQMFLNLLAYSLLTVIRYAIEIDERFREEERRAAEADALRARAELSALRARLNPHFLFNTLHSLLALIRMDPAAAEDALEQFGDLLHYTLRVQPDGAGEVLLRDEWAFVCNYLALEKLRLGERLTVRSKIDPAALDIEVPAFSMQPLVENAIRHGLAPLPQGGVLSIEAHVVEGHLQIEIDDNGRGAEPGNLFNGDGLGLALVRERLRMFEGRDDVMKVETSPDNGFRIEVSLSMS